MIGQHENFETATMAYRETKDVSYEATVEFEMNLKPLLILSIMRMRKYFFSPSSVYSSFISRPKGNADRVD
jgi:hypothetical protein